MSQWRRKANEYLPEFRKVIDDPCNSNPMALWIDLRWEFEELCNETVPNMDLIQRFWKYCLFCLSHRSGDVRTGAALAFCEHLIDTKNVASVLPKLMSRSDFLELKGLILYQSDEGTFDYYLNSLWPPKGCRK